MTPPPSHAVRPAAELIRQLLAFRKQTFQQDVDRPREPFEHTPVVEAPEHFHLGPRVVCGNGPVGQEVGYRVLFVVAALLAGRRCFGQSAGRAPRFPFLDRFLDARKKVSLPTLDYGWITACPINVRSPDVAPGFLLCGLPPGSYSSPAAAMMGCWWLF
jgi:hypothetical protein